MNEAGAYSNWAIDEQSNYGNDIEQFGQLLATLLGNCHSSSEYIKVNKCHCVSERDNALLQVFIVSSIFVDVIVGCRLRNIL